MARRSKKKKKVKKKFKVEESQKELIIKSAFIDQTDKKKKFVAVQVRFKKMLKNPVSLQNIKKNKALKHLSLIKQSRLSVMPIDYKSWKILNKMSNINK